MWRPETRITLGLVAATLVGGGALAGGALASQGERPKAIDHLVVHRLDVVDDKGMLRAVLAAPTPPPIIGGKTYKRIFTASGLVLYGSNGDERGGYVVPDTPDTPGVLTLDHINTDAVGWRVAPDGSIDFMMNERPPVQKDPKTGGLLPANATTRLKVSLAPDGTPSIALADKQERPRVRIAVSPEGYGEIEFLDANGKVVSTLAPEREAK